MSFKRGNAVLRAAVAEVLESRRLMSAGTDPDDQISESTAIQIDQQLNDSISDGSDVDMFKFDVTPGTYEIQTEAFFDNYLRLFDASGSQLDSDDDGGPNGSLIRYTFTEAATFYAGVSGYSNTSYNPITGDGDSSGSTGSYNIVVVEVPPDTNDQISEAIALEPGVTQNGQVSEPEDVDMYSFEADAGAEAILYGGSDFFYHALRLFDGDGQELARSIGYEPEIRHILETGATYYIGVSGEGNADYDPISGNGDRPGATGFYGLSLKFVPADPDDQISEASTILADSPPRNGEISPGTDVDMFKIALAEGDEISIQFHDIPNALFADVTIFNEQGDSLTSANGEVFNLDFTAEFTGNFYIGVASYYNFNYNPITGGEDEFGETGPYRFTIQSEDFDDQFSEAYSLFADGGTDAVIANGRDVDAFLLDFFDEQVRFGVDIDRDDDSQLDSYLRVFRRDYDTGEIEQIAANDNRAAPGESAANGESYIEFTAFKPGDYFAFVSGNPNRNYDPVEGDGDVAGSTGRYTIRFDHIEDLDDQANGDEAVPTPLGMTISGKKIDYDIDVDMYRFIVAAGTTMEFDLDLPSGSSLNSYLRLFQTDEYRTQIAANDNGPAAGESASTKESYLKYYFPTSGEYFIAVSSFPNASYNPITGLGDIPGSSGAYTLITKVVSVATPTTGDSDDQISEARSISTSSPRTNQSIGSKDVDMYKFTVSAGQRIGFDVDRTDGNLDSYLRVFRSNGQQIASNDDGKAPGETASMSAYLEYTFSSGGTYYVAVSGDPNRSYSPTGGGSDVSGSTGGYSLFLTNRTPAAARGVSPLNSPFRKGRAIDDIELS